MVLLALQTHRAWTLLTSRGPSSPIDCRAWTPRHPPAAPLLLQTAVPKLGWPPQVLQTLQSTCTDCGAPLGSLWPCTDPAGPPLLPPACSPPCPAPTVPGGSALIRQPSKEPWGGSHSPQFHVPKPEPPQRAVGSSWGGAEPWGGRCAMGWPRGAMGWLWDGYGMVIGWLWGGCGVAVGWLWGGHGAVCCPPRAPPSPFLL